MLNSYCIYVSEEVLSPLRWCTCEPYKSQIYRSGYGRYRLLYCIVLYLLPILNPKSYDEARVLEASGHPMLVIGRSYVFDSIQDVGITKLTDEMTE